MATAPFEARGVVTDEYLTLMRRTWTTDPVNFEGRHYAVRDVYALPKPVQRGWDSDLDWRPHAWGAPAYRRLG